MVRVALQWKAFSLDLETVEKWMHSNAGDYYVGNQATKDGLELYFSQEPGDSVREAIQDYWRGIKKTHAVAKNYVDQDEIKEAIETAKADMVTKTWDQMSVAQRKLAVGQTPTREDLDI